MSAYDALEEKFSRITRLQEIDAISSWDEACMMPSGSGVGRGRALSELTGVIHEKQGDPEIGELLNKVRAESMELGSWQGANLAAIERAYVEATAVPADLVRACTLVEVNCEQTWRRARAANDWASVQPILSEVVGLNRQRADALADVMGVDRYDALLEYWEPDLRARHIEPVFDDLKGFLPDIVDEILDGQTEPLPLEGPFPVAQQRELCEQTARLLGFDFDRGRFDVSHHPFCGGVPDDTRITTRYYENSFMESLMATCHETGHALYQQGLPGEWREQPVGRALGAAVHESQSLLVELQVCRSLAFIEHLAPLVRSRFGKGAGDAAWGAENLHRHAIKVERGLIRVDADEVTYPLHVILRFELERRLIDGDLAVTEVPEAWNDAMQRYLGLSTGGNHTDGCMQDVHWFAGLFGYFPTYTLGALGAAQWFACAGHDLPELSEQVRRGDLAPLVAWLRDKIHSRGRAVTMQSLFAEVTGQPLDVSFYKAHIEARYLGR